MEPVEKMLFVQIQQEATVVIALPDLWVHLHVSNVELLVMMSNVDITRTASQMVLTLIVYAMRAGLLILMILRPVA